MSMMNKKILIALLCMASALCTLAQVKIMGKVVD